MPYISIEDAKAGKFITILDDVELTLLQINYIANLYDALQKADPPVDKPMAVAISRFKDAYEIKDGAWVPRKKGNMAAILDAIAFEAGLDTEALAYASDWRVQSVTFDSQKYQLQDALDWLNKRGYRIVIDGNSDNKTMTFNQFEKSLCSASSKKQNAGDGIDLFVCKLKSEGVANVKKIEQHGDIDMVCLSSFDISKAKYKETETGGIIYNQIIVHTGEWRDGKVKFTREALEEMLDNHNRLSSMKTAPYVIPYAKSDHLPTTESNIGRWENLHVEDITIPTEKGGIDVTALLGDEHVTNKKAWAAIKRGEWTRRSAEFSKHWKDSFTGNEYNNLLWGAAYVDVPELTSIPPVLLSIVANSTSEAITELRRQADEINRKEGGDNMEEVEKLKIDLAAAETARLKAEDEKKLADAEVERLRAESIKGDDGKEELKRMETEIEKLRGEAKKLNIDKMAGVLAEKSAKGNALPQSVIDKAKVLLTSLYENEGKVTLRIGDNDVESNMADALQGLLIELRDTGLVNLTKLTSGEKPETKTNAAEMQASAKAQGIPMVETVTG